MDTTSETPQMCALVLICDRKLADEVNTLFQQSRLPVHYRLHAKGAASGKLLSMLGLEYTEKAVSFTIAPETCATAAAARLEKKLALGRPNTGIAFTIPLGKAGLPAAVKIHENARKEWWNSMPEGLSHTAADRMTGAPCALTVVIVNRDFGEEVMDAARAAGAHDGTVLKARRIGSEYAQQFFGVSLLEERELVLILTQDEIHAQVMEAIEKSCGMRSEARGIVFSMPVGMTAGIQWEP